MKELNIIHIHKLSVLKKISRLASVYSFLSDLRWEYPGFRKWFVFKVLLGVLSGKRDVLLAYSNDDFAGVSIIKNDMLEKKICTLRVSSMYQKQGIGTALLRESCAQLESNTPLITVSEQRLKEFLPMLEKNGFKIVDVCHSYYSPDFAEYCFNGVLEGKSLEPIACLHAIKSKDSRKMEVV